MPRLIYRYLLNYPVYHCGKAEKKKSPLSTHFLGGEIVTEKTCIWVMWSFFLRKYGQLAPNALPFFFPKRQMKCTGPTDNCVYLCILKQIGETEKASPD